MASREELRAERLKKLELLRTRGVEAYPSKVPRDMPIADIRAKFKELEPAKKDVSIAGRVMALRGQGAIQFVVLDDGTGQFQAVLKRDVLGGDMAFFGETVDLGDIVSVTGELFVTQRGEESVMVKRWTMAAKALLPLPDKWHGLEDPEEKLRKRYLDLLLDPELRTLFARRAKFWQTLRSFLLAEGYLEVETPVLERTTGGADARPFRTHHHALDMDVYLRISAGELWQKRLMVAGFNKVFEIGRIFRNEGISPEHAQDYTQLECYAAYANAEDGMALVERMYRRVAEETFGTLVFNIRGFEVDLGKAWERYDYAETIKKFTGLDVFASDLPAIEVKLHKLGIAYDPKGWNKSRAMDALWKYCRKKLGGPGFLVGVPVELSPLAKRGKDARTAERFQPIIAGSEVGNGYSELNDPLDQRMRFEEQEALRDAGDEEAQMADWEYVEALEHGMPPTMGFGVSERLFAFFAGKPVREAQLFPLLRGK